MARQVFSRRFIAVQGLHTSTTPIVVPAGHVYVIKQLTMYANPLVQPARGFFRDVGSGAALFSAGTNAGTPGWFGFFGSLAFEPGDSFQWHAEVGIGDDIDVYAGGYDLTPS
jgi:hypothetical protein